MAENSSRSEECPDVRERAAGRIPSGYDLSKHGKQPDENRNRISDTIKRIRFIFWNRKRDRIRIKRTGRVFIFRKSGYSTFSKLWQCQSRRRLPQTPGK
jgi:hypothetical protein